MLDVDQLPVPDWGLPCPHCGAPIAGLPSHRCTACGRGFSVRVLLARLRPIPDVGLVCPDCGYSLTGLIEERCPECGRDFDIATLVDEQSSPAPVVGTPEPEPADAAVRKRAPWYTGAERPLPDFGLRCRSCGAPLAGAAADACPRCAAPFDLEDVRGAAGWIALDPFCPEGLSPDFVRGLLYAAQVPYVAAASLLALPLRPRGGRYASVPVTVPRAFFFDALHCFASAGRKPRGARKDWRCGECAELVPGTFDTCWNCGAGRVAPAPGRTERDGPQSPRG